jgi:hypothetical protein
MTRTLDRTCQADASGHRVLILEHTRECNTSGCPGCQPCPEDHCVRCGVQHLDPAHPRTCASCVGEVRNDVLELIDKTLAAHTEYVHRSINSVVFMVAGPAGNYEAHSYIHQSVTSGRLCKCRRRGNDVCLSEIPPFLGPTCEGPCPHHSCSAARRPRVCPDAAFILVDAAGDHLHPLTVLSAWSLTIARLFDHVPPTDVTMGTAARYILTHLTRLAQMSDDEFDFDDMADQITASHRWLSDVLRLGYRPDTAGYCPMCNKQKLVKVWDPRTDGTEYDPRNDDRVFLDTWVCPNPECGQVYTPEEERDRLDLMYVQSADRLPSAELAQRLNVPASTVRNWASERRKLISPVQVIDGKIIDAVWEVTPPRLRSCGRDAAGRKLYRVKDAEALRDRGRVAS